MSSPDLHHVVCCCHACAAGAPLPETWDSTSDASTPDAPGVENAAKPVYSTSKVIDALRTADGSYATIAWAVNRVEYSIDTGPVSAGEPGYASEYLGYQQMTARMKAVARDAFELWDDLIAIDLVEVEPDATADVTFNYSSNTGGGSYASYSYAGTSGGRANFGIKSAKLWFADDWWTHDEDSDLYGGGYGIQTYLHEIGHALGFSHPGAYGGSATYASDASHFQDTRGYTTMSYFDADENGSGTDHAQDGMRYGATPLLHDILAAQAVYGADMTTRTGPTTYGFNSTADRDAFDFTLNVHPVIAIWDASGIDKIDASGWDTDQVLDLAEGAFSSLGFLTDNVAIAYGAKIELGTTGGGNDRLTGNALDNVLTGAGGNDTILAGDGDDILFGGAGADRLDGGNGIDWLKFSDASGGIAIDLRAGTGSAGDALGDVIVGIENVAGSGHGDTITGDDFTSNVLQGLDGDDVIYGRAGHDFLLGGGGDDSLFGGTGRDILRGGTGADLLDGGISLDWVQYGDASSAVALSLERGGTAGDAAGDTFVGIEYVLGSAHADAITGNAVRNLIVGGAGGDTLDGAGGADVLQGDSGNDTLFGGDGFDTLDGGEGADVLVGGDGFDWVRYVDSSAGVAVDLASGTGSGGTAEGDTISTVEWIWGSAHDDDLAGDGAVNIIWGGAGADTITGRAGNDVLAGQGGADVYQFAEGDGIDRVHGFDLAQDTIRFLDTVGGFGDLTITDFRGSAAIGYDPGDVIILTGITVAEVTADIFLFA